MNFPKKDTITGSYSMLLSTEAKLGYTRANDEDGKVMQHERRGLGKALAWLLPLVVLWGCATPEELPEPEPEVVEEEAPVEVAATPRTPARPTAAGPRKPLPPLALTTIVGLDEARTLELLGQPERVRVEAPATIWTYSRGECRLDIYFYPSLRERRLQSLTYEISGGEDESRCLTDFGMASDGAS